MINMVKLPTNKSNLFLRVAKGHFATSHSHINYYIDVTTQKSRLSEAKAVAKELVAAYQHNTIVDTVLCLDGTQVIGTCLANELTKDGFANMNAHQTIYVITPEYTTGSQIILRDNLAPMVKGKHVLILAASLTTGYTVQAAVEAVNYYGGMVAGLSAIFATTHECMGYEVTLCETILGYPSLAAATKSISGPVRSQDPLKTSVQRCSTRWCITTATSKESRTRAEEIPTTTSASRRLPRAMD